MEILHQNGIRLILMRCAGFNNVDLVTVKKLGIRILRVPGYSPEAVAEHAMGLALTVNRRLHKSYIKVRENDFSLGSLMGFKFLSENGWHHRHRQDRSRHGAHLPRIRHEGDCL